MVIHLSTYHLSGGAAVAATRLHRALCRQGIASSLLSDLPSGAEEGVAALSNTFWQKKEHWVRFTAERLCFLPYEKDKRVRFAFSPARVGVDLSEHPLIRAADIIHVHWVNFGFLSVGSLKKLFLLGKPVVWTFHDMWPFTGGCHHSGECENYRKECGNCKFLRNPGVNDLSHRGWTAKAGAYTAVPFAAVTCSRWLEGRARSSSLLKNFRITTIPNPIDTEQFRHGDKRASRSLLGLAPDKDYILFAAAKVSATGKGFHFFRQAVQLLVEKNPTIVHSVELLVLGKGSEESLTDLPLKATSMGYLQDAEQIGRVYNAASMFVTTSLEENLPNTIMEAMACGTPAVGFSTGGIPEMIDHLENGYVAAYKSAESVRDGIVWVLEQGEELGEKARAKVVRTYAEDIVARQYNQLYTALLENKRP